MMKLLQIPPEILKDVWPIVGPLLEKAVAMSRGTATLEDMAHRISTKDAQLWTVLDTDQKNKIVAAGLTSLRQYPGGLKLCYIESFGGEGMPAWFALKTEFEKWAKDDEGCAAIRIDARKGWLKHLKDYQRTHVVLMKAL